MNKVFVTGADGMLGSSICRELIKQNYTVKAMCLPNSSAITLKDLNIEIVKGDVLDKAFLLKEMKDCDFVINVAALTYLWPRRNEKVNEVNYYGVKNVMEVVETFGIKRMIQIGSASSFKPGDKQNPGSENCEFDGWRHKMDYIDSKYLAQKMLLDKHKTSHFPVVIINPTYMIGPFDSGPSSGEMLLKLYNDELPGYCVGGKNFVCSTDVATAAVNAIVKGKIGSCYIAGNQNLEYKEFFHKATDVMGKKFKLKKVPRPIILLAGAINSAIARVAKKKPKLSYGVAKMANLNQYFSPQLAVNELNMPQTPIEEGIKQCISWFKENGYIK